MIFAHAFLFLIKICFLFFWRLEAYLGPLGSRSKFIGSTAKSYLVDDLIAELHRLMKQLSSGFV